MANEVNPSSLIAYTGVRALETLESYGRTNKSLNCIKLMMYYDIFKNYYANKQEKNFYVISGNTYYTYRQIANSLKKGEISLTIANSINSQSTWKVVTTGVPNTKGSTGEYPKAKENYQAWILAINPYGQDEKIGQIEVS